MTIHAALYKDHSLSITILPFLTLINLKHPRLPEMATPISSTDKSVLTSNNDPATVEETAQDLKEGLKTMLEESVEKVKGMADT